MKKSLLLFVCLIFIAVSFGSQPVQAHFSKTDNSMTVTFHVDPDDSPIPGQPATLYFLFDDKTKKFELTKCQCVITITEQGKQIFSQSLTPRQSNKPSIWGTDMPFTFPQRDVYQISLKGTPTETNDFQPFSLSWDFRVDQSDVLGQSTQERPEDHTALLSMLAIFLGIPILFGIFIFLIIRFGKE